jgi:hypothetical protein
MNVSTGRLATGIEARKMTYHNLYLSRTMKHCYFTVATPSMALLFTVLVLIMTETDSAHADPRTSFHYGYPIDFALTLSNSDIDLRAGDTLYPVALERVNFSIFSLEEQNIQFGFNTGSSYLSLDNDIALAGLSLNGYHAGFALRGQYGRNPQLGLHADYRYQETRNKTADQSVTLSWHEWTVAATGRVILGQRLGLMLGWAYSEIKARRRARGDINGAFNMELDSAPQTQLELEWLTATGGSISLALQKGAYENLAFKFAQTFK